jgi:hypothetical protein
MSNAVRQAAALASPYFLLITRPVLQSRGHRCPALQDFRIEPVPLPLRVRGPVREERTGGMSARQLPF